MPYESADIVRLTSFRGHLGRLERRSSCAWFFYPPGNLFVTGWCFFPDCLPLIFKHPLPKFNMEPKKCMVSKFPEISYSSGGFRNLNQIHPARGSCFPLCIQWTCLKKINATIPWWVNVFIFLQLSNQSEDSLGGGGLNNFSFSPLLFRYFSNGLVQPASSWFQNIRLFGTVWILSLRFNRHRTFRFDDCGGTKNHRTSSRYFRFQLPFSVSVIGSVTVGLVLTQDNELGEVLVAVMGGSTPAKVVTSTGASVQVDAAVLQQLGTTGEGCGCFFVGQFLFEWCFLWVQNSSFQAVCSLEGN